MSRSKVDRHLEYGGDMVRTQAGAEYQAVIHEVDLSDQNLWKLVLCEITPATEDGSNYLYAYFRPECLMIQQLVGQKASPKELRQPLLNLVDRRVVVVFTDDDLWTDTWDKTVGSIHLLD